MRHDTSVLLFALVSAWAGCENRAYFDWPRFASDQAYTETSTFVGIEVGEAYQQPHELIAVSPKDGAPPAVVPEQSWREGTDSDTAPPKGSLPLSVSLSPKGDDVTRRTR